MESDKEQARWLIKCVSDGRMTGGMAAEIEDYCFARRTELEKLTAERDHLRILYNTARDGMREVGELLETCRIELAESRAEVERLQGYNESLLQERDSRITTVAGLRRALEEIRAAVTTSTGQCGVLGTNWAECDYCGAVSQERMTPIPHEKGCAFAVSTAALAASPADHERRIKAEGLREVARAASVAPGAKHWEWDGLYNFIISEADRLEKEATNGR